ncbi:hypothetical protein DVH05_005231 [Phytophthora capsici]|nr:hypothetical protein DVH05_005231 [Phytophthora capsici]
MPTITYTNTDIALAIIETVSLIMGCTGLVVLVTLVEVLTTNALCILAGISVVVCIACRIYTNVAKGKTAVIHTIVVLVPFCIGVGILAILEMRQDYRNHCHDEWSCNGIQQHGTGDTGAVAAVDSERSALLTEGPLWSSCRTTKDRHDRQDLDSDGRAESSQQNLPGRRKESSQQNWPDRREADSGNFGTGSGIQQTAWRRTNGTDGREVDEADGRDGLALGHNGGRALALLDGGRNGR